MKQKYKYEESGLSNVLIEGLSTQDDADEEIILIPNVYGLHKLIAEDILISPGRMKGEEIKFIRTEMGMNHEEFEKLTNCPANFWKHVESGKSKLSPINEAWFRGLAMEKLGLDKPCHSQEDIIGWCRGPRRRKISLQSLRDPNGQPVGEYRISGRAA